LLHPFGFGFEDVLVESTAARGSEKPVKALPRKVLCFGDDYSMAPPPLQKKVRFRTVAAGECRGGATT
jgi:hypothetical protein